MSNKISIEVTSDKFRSNLATYINEVYYGVNEVIITRRGKPHVKLIRIDDENKSTLELAKDELKKFSEQSDEDFLTRIEIDKKLDNL